MKKIIVLDNKDNLLVYIENKTEVFKWAKILCNNMPEALISLEVIAEYYNALIKSGYNGLMEIIE